ncbi:MAG: hypothetical protein DWQ02_01180 [Bacteroidetes bacterium]|nr:MAG: hypothetical protein DWQ02_01180 [Bacteroidota bacterium]
MDIPNKLRKELVEFIKSIPNIYTKEVKRSFIFSASLDSALVNQIDFEATTNSFAEFLINTLYDYGSLKDGREPITAVLLEASELVGFEVDGIKRGDPLIAKWKSFLAEKTINSRISMTPERRFYLTSLIEEVSRLRLSRIIPDQVDDISVDRVYVDILTNIQLHLKLEGFKLHLKLEDYKITDWWVNSNLPSDTNIQFAFSRTQPRGYDTQIIERIVSEAQDFIKGVEGKISPLEMRRPKIFKPFWDDGIKDNYYTLDSFDVAASTKRLILVGVPGSGKSTFAQYFTLFLAQQQLDSSTGDANINRSPRWPHGALTPIFIEIKKFVDWDGFPDIKDSITIKHFWDYVCGNLLGLNNRFADDLFSDLISGAAVIIFDGLDEAFAPINILNGKEKRIQQITEFSKKLSRKFSDCRIIFTTRVHEFSNVKKDFAKADFKIVEMEPLQATQITTLAKNIYNSVGFSSEETDVRAEKLSNELEFVADFLKKRPLFLTLMVMLSLHTKTNKLPAKKGALLHQSVSLLIGRWTRNRMISDHLKEISEIDEETNEIFESLENIAYRAQEHIETGEQSTISVGAIYAEFSRYEYRTYEIVNYLTKQAGIFEFAGTDNFGAELFRFSHRVFQEFLAASYLVRTRNYLNVRDKIENNYLQWREPCILLGDLILNQGDTESFWGLIEILSIKDIPEKNTLESKHWYPVWLAAKLIIENNEAVQKSMGDYKSIVDSLKGKIKLLLTLPKVLSPINRVECGTALGYLGDDRVGVGLNDGGTPDIDWCFIPGGEYEMGLSREQFQKLKDLSWAGNWNYDDQMPSNIVDLPDYYISRYPITIKQYQVFLKAHDGYRNDAWWTKTGLELRDVLEASMNERITSPDNLPQNFVSWYEANAYCKWLSNRVGYQVKLPSEPEWEKAARGSSKRLYPWGDNYDPELCNVAETGIAGPSPVGCFPFPNGCFEEDTPLDLCGNVWEWCTTLFRIEPDPPFLYPYKIDDGREEIERKDHWITVTRGGSFTNIPYLAQVTFRGRDRPSFNPRRQGFRIVKYKLD